MKQFALDMRQAFPNETGFSDTNVKYMKRWYSFYFERVTKSHQLGDQIETAEKSHQLGDQLEMPELFGKVPWRHHVQIFSHCGTLDEALFYIGVATYQLQEVVDRTVAEQELKKKQKEDNRINSAVATAEMDPESPASKGGTAKGV